MNASIRLPLCLALGSALCGAAAQAADPDGSARYRVTFERTWSSKTHPADFPLLAHFSPVIGATHREGYELFHEGGTASAGLEKLCEEGKHQPLDSEIQDALKQGNAGALIETSDPLRDVPQSVTAEFEIDAAHPLVTIGAMIAPSPDWCALATDVSLVENGSFVQEKTVSLQAWDVGTDSAKSYRALDSDTQPRDKVRPSDSPYFQKGGAPNPVGRVTFTRIR